MKYPKKNHLVTGALIISLILIAQAFALPDTNKEVLSQKILLENTIHQRVSDAVYRVVRNENFIVNVNVIMEASPVQQYTTIYETPDSRAQNAEREAAESKQMPVGLPEKELRSEPEQTKTRTVLKKRPIKTSRSSDIPGFPGIQSPGFELYEEEVPVVEDNTDDVVYAAEDNLAQIAAQADTTAEVAAEATLSLEEDEVVLEEDIQTEAQQQADEKLVDFTEPVNARLSRHTVASTQGPSLRVKKMELTVILEDPISPKLIENVRTVAMVASHFNRDRGDRLQVMTADFEGSKEQQPDTEQLLLKSIAEKMTAIEARQKQDKENERIRQLRLEQDRVKMENELLQQQKAENDSLRKLTSQLNYQHELALAKMKKDERDRAERRQRFIDSLRAANEAAQTQKQEDLLNALALQAKERLSSDSSKLADLTDQLDNLKKQLSAVDLEEEQRLKLELEQKRREAEKTAIREREERLQNQMKELESQRLQASVMPQNEKDELPLLILGGAALLLLAILIGALMGSRRRRPDDIQHSQEAPKLVEEEPVVEPEPDEPEAQEEELPEPEVDEELAGEVDSIKKSIVSLAVSKPGSASSIVKDWLQDKGAEEESSETETESEEENGSGKKKKKGRK